MKKTYLCVFILLLTSSLAFSQLVFRHHYFQTDLSKFKTYQLAGFTINGVRANPEDNSQISAVQSKLHEALSQREFKQGVEPDMLVFLLLKVDTLGVDLPDSSKRELMASFTLDIRQNPGFEKIFKGTVNGLIVTDDKSEKRLKKIYRRFFTNFER